MRPFTNFALAAIALLFSCASKTKEVLYQATDFSYVGDFTASLEGPAVDNEGTIYFVNPVRRGAIGKIDPEGNFSVFIEQLPDNSTANGIRIDKEGKLWLADYTGHKILKITPETKTVEVYASHEELNQPNDLTMAVNGRIFASDPNWAESTGKIWLVENNQFFLLEDSMGTTNGIELSPDNKILYVNESVQRKVWAFDITDDSRLTNKRLLASFDDFGMDGMRCDVKGNLYITRHGKGTVVKVSPEGELLEEIVLKGKKPSNIAFGGPDGRTAYITLQDRGFIETFRVSDPGFAYQNMVKQ